MSEDTRIEGWPSIADALGMSEKTARKFAVKGAFGDNKDLLPVRRNCRGPYMSRQAFEEWFARNDMAWQRWDQIARSA